MAEDYSHYRDILERCGGNKSQAALEAGCARSTFSYRLDSLPEAKVPIFPVFPEEELGAEQMLDHYEAQFLQARAYSDAATWFAIREPEDKPIAYNWFGDPHLGPHCNVPLLRRDIGIINDTPGMYGANLGDVANNWGGKLVRLYADEDISRRTERNLARWFLEDAGIEWRIWLEGNHDHMDGALVAHLRAINANRIPMIDWCAKFQVCFPNGCEIRVDARHDHKGHSMWNPLHGQGKAASMDEQADLYIAGHKHNWALMQREMPGGWVANLARGRGYKHLDEYALHGGFHQQDHGSSIVTVFNPLADSPVNRVVMFADVEAGAEYLTYLRAKS